MGDPYCEERLVWSMAGTSQKILCLKEISQPEVLTVTCKNISRHDFAPSGTHIASVQYFFLWGEGGGKHAYNFLQIIIGYFDMNGFM